jgi:23S rRNA (guanosine2251-2'-O)-methyltransferase
MDKRNNTAKKYNNHNNYKNRDNKAGARALDVPEVNNDCLVVGRNAVRELLSGGRDIEKIYIQSGEREGSINQLVAEASARRIPFIELDKARLDRMCAGARHQGIIAIASEQNYSTVEEILEYAAERGEAPFIVLLDGVEDPHNFGAIIRSAECMGVHGIIIPKRRAVGLTPTVSKASAGAIEHMRVAKVTNLSTTIDELKERGLWFYAADMDGSDYYETDMTGACAVVLGSEGFGVSRLVKEKCDFTVSIPLYGMVNSLNVSYAGAVIMTEVARQRKIKRG